MAMGVIWTALAAAALVCGAVSGRLDAVTAAALEGAGAAVELVLCSRGQPGAALACSGMLGRGPGPCLRGRRACLRGGCGLLAESV